MNVAEIELKLRELAGRPYDPSTLPYDILEIYDAPRATVAKLRNGSMNKGEAKGDVLWKGKLYFRPARKGKAAETLDVLSASPAAVSNKPRFLISTDGEELSSLDTKSGETFHSRFCDLHEQFDFLLPLAGVERYKAVAENPADIKAADRLAKFYDAILEHNPDWKATERRHALNQFMTRTLFCMFAEDTGIFKKDLFTKTVDEFTDDYDAGDVHEVLGTIFDAMDRKKTDRKGLPSYTTDFEYVNGGLFRDRTDIPPFSKKARRVLIEAAQLNWAEINPDIFGSMIQAVVDPSMRGDLGMHYTSVPNIMKLIGPLFLDRLEKEFEESKNSPKRLERLLSRIYRIRVFDPACGSGNFLIISYRELRRLEMRIFKRLQEISPQFTLPMSQVRLSQFYGIEYADFAAETAKLSLWISEYQANKEFEATFGSAPPALPLKDSGNIICGNALRKSWQKVCPPSEGSETFIVGNPPYLGRAQQTPEQKEDMETCFRPLTDTYGNLDYVSAWFLKGAQYASRIGAEFAFVATNSICQGEQVSLLWPHILGMGLEISFAHRSFKWQNSAAKNAGVTCVIVGVRRQGEGGKTIFEGNLSKPAVNINPYLVDMDNLFVTKCNRPISTLPTMLFGNMPNDGGNLLLSPSEKKNLEEADDNARAFIRPIVGSQEFIHGIERYCIWIREEDRMKAMLVPEIAKRVEKTRLMRLASKRPGTKALADVPYRFGEIRGDVYDHVIAVPSISSENRAYLPCGILSSETLVNNKCFQIIDGPIYVLALIASRLHYVWMEAIGGRLETRFTYSNTLVYNTFPVPDLSEKQKEALEGCAWKVIEEREANPGKTIAELYDPKTMPKSLLEAHQDLDATLETIYRGRPFKDDAERLEHLFKLYAAKTGKAAPRTKGRGNR